MSTLISTLSTSTANVNYPCIDISCSAGYLDISQPYTIMAHIKRLSTSTAFGNLTHYFSLGTDDYSYYDEVSSSGSPTRTLSFETQGGGGGATGGPYLDDVIYHVAFVRTSSSGWTAYVNGVAQGTFSGSAHPGGTLAKLLRLGGSLGGGSTQNQSVDNEIVVDCVRIYDVALSASEVLDESQSRRAVRTSNLVCDIAVCGPGDYLSYGGSATIAIPNSTFTRNTSASVVSYYDLVQGPLTGSPPSEEPIIDFFGADQLIVINGLSNDDMTVDAEYIYSRWKEWVAAGNAQFLPAFRTIGGDPIGGGVEVGAYFFLRNDLGWRIQAKGHTHELTITGNLYPEASTTPVFELPGDAFPTQTLIKQQVSSLTQVVTVVTGGGGGGTSSSVYIGDTPPANPVAGDLWWNSATGLMMIYYNDGNSSQWVIANPTGGGGDCDCPTAEEIRIEMDTNSTKLQDIYQNTIDIEIIVTDIQNTLATSFPTLANIADAVWSAALNQYAGGSPASAGFIVSTILNEVIDVHDDTNDIQTIVGNITLTVDEILKYDRNRTRIDKAAKTLTVYDDDEITPIRVFNLLDGTGAPSVAEVCERDPI